MTSIQLHYSLLTVDDSGLATITGVNEWQIVSEVGTRQLLEQMEYSDVLEWVADKEQQRLEDANE